MTKVRIDTPLPYWAAARLPVRAIHALKNAGLMTLDELRGASPETRKAIRESPNLGRITYTLIAEVAGWDRGGTEWEQRVAQTLRDRGWTVTPPRR